MQPFCPNGNIMCVKLGSEVEFTKMRTKTCYVYFFKDSLNKRAGTPILELDKGKVSTFAKFKYERSSSKTEWVFEKTNMISSFFSLERKTTFWAGSKFYVEMWPALRKGSDCSYSQRTLSIIGTRGGKKNYDNGDYDDNDDDDDDYDDDDYDNDDYNMFSSSQRPSNRVGTSGSR